MSAVGGNYISDGAIMAWLATQQDRIYGDLKGSMDLAERRADFQSALTNVKTHLADANANEDFSTVDKELQGLLETYGSEPEFAEACEALKPMAERIHADVQYKNVGYAENKAAYDGAVGALELAKFNGELDFKSSAVVAKGEPPMAISSYKKQTIDDWANILGGQVDNAGRNDQLTMIHIQELKATLDQGSQLASTFISSGDKTTSSILNNFV